MNARALRLRRRYGRGHALGPRPANPADISFDPRCFVNDGVVVEWHVGGNVAPNYPKNFGENEAAAREYARRTGREWALQRVERPRRRRISWTAPVT